MFALWKKSYDKPRQYIKKQVTFLMLKLKIQYFVYQTWKPKKRLWCWENMMAGGEGGDRGWDGWMAALTQLTWVWVNCGRWWWTGKPSRLQSTGSQRRTWLNDWTTALYPDRSSCDLTQFMCGGPSQFLAHLLGYTVKFITYPSSNMWRDPF